VRIGDVTLVKGTDYMVGYEADPADEDIVNVFIKGIGFYKGTVEGSYRIIHRKADSSSSDIKDDSSSSKDASSSSGADTSSSSSDSSSSSYSSSSSEWHKDDTSSSVQGKDSSSSSEKASSSSSDMDKGDNSSSEKDSSSSSDKDDMTTSSSDKDSTSLSGKDTDGDRKDDCSCSGSDKKGSSSSSDKTTGDSGSSSSSVKDVNEGSEEQGSLVKDSSTSSSEGKGADNNEGTGDEMGSYVMVKKSKMVLPPLKRRRGSVYRIVNTNKSAISVNSRGIVKAKAAGTAIIYGNVGDNICKYNFTVEAPYFRRGQKKVILNMGGEADVPLIGTQLDVTYTSKNPQVASVDEKGHINALAKGSTVITAVVGGQKYKLKVKVLP